jgi:hypothetical protein
MCGLTDTGVRANSHIDTPGIWHVAKGRHTGVPLYLQFPDGTRQSDMRRFCPEYLVRVKCK